MKDLDGLAQAVIDALAALPSDASADTRKSAVAQLVDAHMLGLTKGISHVSEYGEFLRDLGFAKAAVKKLAPAFKAISGDEGAADTMEAAERLRDELRSIAATLKD